MDAAAFEHFIVDGRPAPTKEQAFPAKREGKIG